MGWEILQDIEYSHRHGRNQRGERGSWPSLNVKKEKIKKKFLEDTQKVKCLMSETHKVKCLMSVYKKLVLEKKRKEKKR